MVLRLDLSEEKLSALPPDELGNVIHLSAVLLLPAWMCNPLWQV